MSKEEPKTHDGNSVTMLRNGREIFPAMLESIRSAERTICLETYVYWSGDIAIEFAEALAERARNGVKVHVLIDWHGSMRMEEKIIEIMTDGGVEVERFRPFHWLQLDFIRTNHRTHRKLLIADGKIAFTGGVGIADEWTGDAEDTEHWRDNHFQVEGPVVADIQRAFLVNWKHVDAFDDPDEDDKDYFPKLKPVGEIEAKVFSASPLNGSETIYKLFLHAIADAKESLDIASAYFVPGKNLVNALVDASKCGVRIRILVGGPHIDKTVVRYASRSLWGDLFKAGIQIFEFQPTLLHVKSIIVDRRWASIGSANFDVRSCRLNDELNLVHYGESLIDSQIASFSQDCQNANPITLEQWEARPLWTKALDWLALRLRKQL